MFFIPKRVATPDSPLRPFLLRTGEGFLTGLAMDPAQGSPCVRCIQGWLERRGLGSQIGKLDELTVRRDVLDELRAENSPHVLYEIHHDGTVNRLKSPVFPFPGCACSKSNYQGPALFDPSGNYSFSPLAQLKCSRYVTPEGHLWLTSALGNASKGGESIQVFGSGRSKDASRKSAIDQWLKRAAIADLKARVSSGETIATEILQTGNGDFLSSVRGEKWESVGAGKDYEEATLDALYALTRERTLRGYANSVKNPMLMVGTNNWIRARIPYFLLQEYDIHLLFYPNASPCWVVGLAAFSRIKSDARPVFTFNAGSDMTEVLEGCLAKLLEWARPEAAESVLSESPMDTAFNDKAFKLNLWWTHWIYRCSKIAMKDVLHLEAYPKSVDFWRDYMRDGQAPVSIVPLNHPDLPVSLRTLVQLVQKKEENPGAQRVIGIGTLSRFQESMW
jgi:hypothetical protein